MRITTERLEALIASKEWIQPEEVKAIILDLRDERTQCELCSARAQDWPGVKGTLCDSCWEKVMSDEYWKQHQDYSFEICQYRLDRYKALIRFQRHELFEAKLISEQELAALVAEGNTEPLETYDQLRAQLENLHTRRKKLRQALTAIRLEAAPMGSDSGNLAIVRLVESALAADLIADYPDTPDSSAALSAMTDHSGSLGRDLLAEPFELPTPPGEHVPKQKDRSAMYCRCGRRISSGRRQCLSCKGGAL